MSENRELAGTFSLLVSAAATLSLQNAILPEIVRDTEDDGSIYVGNLEDSDAQRRTNRRNQTHSTTMGHTGGTERLHTSTDKMRHAG